MGYLLSVDLGTTFTAAALAAGGSTRMVALGTRATVIPSVVALRADGAVLTGEAAERRAIAEPARAAREFKRRLGDPTPIVIGGTPYGAEALMAHLLRATIDLVAEREGAAPEKVVLSHPAGYGPYKLDLMRQVGHLAGLSTVGFITEPQAAAVHYSGLERIEPGEVVAVYDLGGGTFDAALVRRTGDGFELLGTPDGLERFGGIDIDDAVFAHVRRSLGEALESQDPGDAGVVAGLSRLREDCRAGKEALSVDTDVSIPVMLPSLHTEVRLTRAEFEDMIRPRIRETVGIVERMVSGAGLGPGDVTRVVLVGGSSRIPLVSEMVREATGLPVGRDADPKNAISLGAAEAGFAIPPAAGGAPPPPAEVEENPAGDETQPVRAPESPPAAGVEPAAGGRWRPPLVAAIVGAVVVIAAVVIGVLAWSGGDDPAASGTTLTSVTVPGEEPAEGAGGEPAPVEGPAPAPEVMALYRTDFTTPDGRGSWGAWADADGSAPPDDIASDYYPALGVYDAADPAVTGRHLAWMRAAGIGTVAPLWEGPDSPGARVLEGMLELLDRYDMRFALAVRLPEPRPEVFFELMSVAREMYGESQSWLRLPRPGSDEPHAVVLLYFPEGAGADPGAWASVLQEVSSQGVAVLVGATEPDWIEAGAAGVVGGPIDGGFGWATPLPDQAIYAPEVSPGGAGRRVGDPDVDRDRAGGAWYTEQWELAHAARRPGLVVVRSFNDWVLGSQIEPAMPEPPERPGVPYLTYSPLDPEAYLAITAEFVDAFGYR